MTLTKSMAGLAEVVGEVDGIRRWYPKAVDAVNELPAAMPLPLTGGTQDNGGFVLDRPRNHTVRIWVVCAPLSAQIGHAMDLMAGLIDPVMDALTTAYAAPRHRAIGHIRRLEVTSYRADTPLAVGDGAYYGIEFLVAIQEDPRVQLP